jgi:choice-of-anchor C domain-containing protein
MKSILSCALVLCVAAASAQGASVVNGSFEQDAALPVGGFANLGNGSTAITGWTVGGSSVDWIGTYWQNADGNRSLDLSGGGAGAISQVLTGLSVGTTYALSFALSGNPTSGNRVKSLSVSVGNEAGGYTYDVTGNTLGNMNWVTETFNFTADATSETLTFTSNEPNAYGPALDDVRLSAVDAPVPLPAAVWLLAGAIGGLGMLRRRG